MRKFIFKEQKIKEEYQYVFLCGTHYLASQKKDKRNVLRSFLQRKDAKFRPIILEDNFIFKKNSSRFLVYDDIHMKDLYQVEMLMNYLSDSNIIVHESISTGAETGLFLSECDAVEKTCLLVPDEVAVEEDKLGQFIRLSFLRDPYPVKVITYYPSLEQHIRSENVKYWHTYFYKNTIGDNLGKQIIDFLKNSDVDYGIRFTQTTNKIKEQYIYYKVEKKNGILTIRVLPRVLLICVAGIFNIKDCETEIFGSEKRELKKFVELIIKWLKFIFKNTIEELTGAEVKDCRIQPEIKVRGVYIAEIAGMFLYLFQAAGFIQIKKDSDYKSNGKVSISKKILQDSDGNNYIFYKKYESCISYAVENQIK